MEKNVVNNVRVPPGPASGGAYSHHRANGFHIAGILVGLIWPGQVLPNVKPKPVVLFSKVALALVLFTDATRIKIRALRRGAHLPARLLAS